MLNQNSKQIKDQLSSLGYFTYFSWGYFFFSASYFAFKKIEYLINLDLIRKPFNPSLYGLV